MKARLRLIEYDPVTDVYHLEATSPGLDKVESFLFLDFGDETEYLDDIFNLVTQKAHSITPVNEAELPPRLMWVETNTKAKESWETHGLSFWRIDDVYLRVASGKKGHLVHAFSINARWWPRCKGPSLVPSEWLLEGDMFLMDGETTCVRFCIPMSKVGDEFMHGQTAGGLYATSVYIWMDGDNSRLTIQIGKQQCSWMGFCSVDAAGVHTFTTDNPDVLNFKLIKKRETN